MTLESKKVEIVMDAADTYQDFEKQWEDEIGKKKSGKRGGSTKVAAIKQIVIETDGFADAMADNDTWITGITYNKTTAEKYYSDKEVIFKAKEKTVMDAAPTSTLIVDQIRRYPVDRYIIRKEIHFFASSSGNGTAVTYHYDIGFKYEYVSDWQLARMVGRLM